MQFGIQLMHAGVREIFTAPLDPAELTAAMERTARNARLGQSRIQKKTAAIICLSGLKGRMRRHHTGIQFCARHGPGIRRQTLLIDLGLPWATRPSTSASRPNTPWSTALEQARPPRCQTCSPRWWPSTPGLSVLAAPLISPTPMPLEAIDKLISVARESTTTSWSNGIEHRSDGLHSLTSRQSSTWSRRWASRRCSTPTAWSRSFSSPATRACRLCSTATSPATRSLTREDHRSPHPARAVEDSR